MANRIAQYLDNESVDEDSEAIRAVIDEAEYFAKLIGSDRIRFCVTNDADGEPQFEADCLGWYYCHEPKLVLSTEPIGPMMARELRRLAAQILADALKLEGGAA